MFKNTFYIICILSAPLCYEMTGDIIQPSDVKLLPKPPRGCFAQIHDAMYPKLVSRTNPEIPASIRDVGNCFLGTFAGMHLREEPKGRKEVYFRKAHMQMYSSHDAGRSQRYIPSVVFRIGSFVIEANSKAILRWGFCLERNRMETRSLSESASLSAEQIFAKAVPILEHNNLSTDSSNYRVYLNRNFSGLEEIVEFPDSTWRVETASPDTESDRILLWFTRCSGRLVRLMYYPSVVTIERWYEYQNKGKE